MANDHWISAYYVSKFISSTGTHRMSSSGLGINSSQGTSPPGRVPSKQSSLIVRELALDKTLRRRVMKERRKAFREGL